MLSISGSPAFFRDQITKRQNLFRRLGQEPGQQSRVCVAAGEDKDRLVLRFHRKRAGQRAEEGSAITLAWVISRSMAFSIQASSTVYSSSTRS